ncbi:MAG: methyltransferase [Pseudomonadota bacterium]
MPDTINKDVITEDGFLDNSFAVLQPKKGAHRAGLDAVLLAACVPVERNGLVADFGAGTGVAGMAVAQRCPQAQVELIENDAETVDLLRRTLILSRNFHIADRLSVTEADVTTLDRPRFSHIIANPPFNARGQQPSPHTRRAAAHIADPSLFEEWIEAAKRTVLSNGHLTMIVRAESQADIETAMAGSFGNRLVLPIVAKPDREPIRIIITGQQGGADNTHELPPLILHQPDGRFTDQVEDILRGRAGLDLHNMSA